MIIKIQLVVNINPKSLTIFSHLISDPETLTVKFLSNVFFFLLQLPETYQGWPACSLCGTSS